MNSFSSSTVQYAPLSGIDYDDGNPIHDGGPAPLQQPAEKASLDEPIAAHRGRRCSLSLRIFTLGILVGAGFGVLGSTFIQRMKHEGWSSSTTNIKQFAPQMPLKTTVFSARADLMDRPSETNQRSWDAFMPPGHGFVNISNPEDYGLLHGIPTASGVDRYSVAMFHQLHCLGRLRNNYWRLIDDMSEDRVTALRQEEVHQQLGDRHSQHCFAYLAESIMCAGDLTIEWAMLEKDGSRKQVDGWGVPHQCKDPDAIWAWMNANHGPLKEGHVHLHD